MGGCEILLCCRRHSPWGDVGGTMLQAQNDARAREGRAVFGLPGNPVSALIGVELFCVPYLGRVSGGAARPHATGTGVLTGEITKKAGRRLFAPAVRTGASSADGLPLVEPVPTHGSADLVAHSRAGIIVTVPAQAVRVGPGDEVEIYEFRG